MNKMKIVFAVYAFLFLGCVYFVREKANIVIKNYSHRNIDSIYIPITKDFVKGPVFPGAREKIAVMIPRSTKHKSGLSIDIFQNGIKKSVTYGYCDPGFGCTQTDTVISVYNHGITTNNRSLDEPAEYFLYLFDKTSKRIDSVTVEKGILIKEGDTNGKIFILNYALFRQDPVINIYMHGLVKSFPYRIEHDWDNWNSYQKIVEIFDKDIPIPQLRNK